MTKPGSPSPKDHSRYTAFVAAAFDAIITIDDNGRVLEFNPSAETMFGWTAQEAIGKLISDLIIPFRYRKDHKQGVRHYLNTGEAPVLGNRINIEVLHHDGHEFPVELSVTSIQINDQTVFTAFIRDTTQSKELNRKLQIANFTIQQSSDSIYWIREDGSIMDCNIAAATGLGYSREELLDMTVFDLDPIMTREAWPIHWHDLRETGSVHIESLHQRSDRTSFPVDVSANYILYEGKEYNCAFVRDITLRKATEHEIIESSRRLSLVLDAAELGFWDIDFRTNEKIVNAQYIQNFGISEDEFSPEESWFRERVHPDDSDRIYTLLQDHLASRSERIDAQYRIRRGDGTWRWIHDRGRVVERDEGSNAVRMMGAMQDITHRKEASDALHRSEQRFSDIVASIGEFIWETDADLKIRYISDPITTLTGTKQDLIVGVMFSEITTKEHAEHVGSVFKSCLRSGEPIRDLEMPVIAQDGKMRWARLNAQPVRSDTGTYTGFRGTGQDITAERAAADAKTRSIKLQAITRAIVMDMLKPGELSRHIDSLLARLGAFLNADRAYLLRTETKLGRVLCSSYWFSERLRENKASYPLTMSGLDPEWVNTLKPNHPVVIHGGSDSSLPKWVNPMTSSHLGMPVLIDGVPMNYLVFEGLDEHPFWTEDDISILMGLASSLGYAIERRISKRKLEESALQLENEARRAEAANEAKSIFLAQMSHELRTPLTAVIGSAQILSAKSDATRESQLLASIDYNGRTLLSVINSILDLSKFEREGTSLRTERVSIAEMIKQIRASVMPLAMKDGIDISFEIRSRVPSEIVSDGFQLAQVLTNLINNALKYSKSPCVEVQIAIAEESPDMIQFEVIDHGIGIDREDLDRIFEPFERATKSTSSGTGLGLAICKRIVDAFGGSIQCESVTGIRTRFWFTIPIGDQSSGELMPGVLEPVRQAALTPTIDNTQPLRNIRVLLVEDNMHIREVVEYFLLDMGASVEICVHGLEAVARIQDSEDPIDVILMDMQMPVMDGYEATKVLRNEGATVPIIALTAHGLAEDRKKCIDAGCDDYLGKPINPELLAITINRAVYRVPHRTDPATPIDQDSTKPSSIAPPNDLVDRYQDHLRTIVDQLNPSLNDPDSIRWTVHQIKGTAGTMGLTEIAQAALRADKLIRQSAPPESVTESLADLVRKISDV